MASALVIDDEKAICEAIGNIAATEGHKVSYALTLKDGLKQVRSGDFDVVFLDVRLPDGNGLHGLPQIRRMPCSPEVIIITGEGSPDGAELAIKSGAWDYIEKPLSVEAVQLSLLRALQYREQRRAKRPFVALKRDGIVGSSVQMRHCVDLLAHAASCDLNVLITGETGTGKELFARAIHENSVRAPSNFVVVDCAALPETLVESTLFGHKKGAFTGADTTHEGLVKQADRGTLFLDEVGELSLSVQKRFLRVLEDRRFRPVGSSDELASDFRVVAATNRNLDEMVKTGGFRKDLLFRLRSMVIDLPPLRERREDIQDIACHFTNRFCDRLGTEAKGLSPEFLSLLHVYNWPGNVRELVHCMEMAVYNARDASLLLPIHAPEHIRIAVARASVKNGIKRRDFRLNDDVLRIDKPFQSLREYLATKERKYLEYLISASGGDLKRACEVSGLPRSSFYERLKKHNLTTRS
ncbi:MAG: sigma-54-dependent Fis family transcriptional regulator [Deltaproteobacteria bacterium]|nr:sigma-54-dependent Fis family transcriptional regulator [Deltaproteobacteria bacterium]